MTVLEINEKKYSLPTSFDELEFGTYSKLYSNLEIPKDDEMDEFETAKKIIKAESAIISRLLGESDDFAIDLPIEIYLKIKEKIAFLYDSDYISKQYKSYIKIDGDIYSIPSFSEMPLRQYIDAEQVISSTSDNKFVEMLAILLSKKGKDGKFVPYDGDYSKLFKKLNKIPTSEVLGLLNFYYKKKVNSERIMQVYSKLTESLHH